VNRAEDNLGYACEGDVQARSTADAVARRSYGKLIAYLVARTRDVAAAEDALSEAFASALQHWPRDGCPANPEAWLLTVARRKMIDSTRKRTTNEGAVAEIQLLAEGLNFAAAETEIPDHRLALMFACTHPAIEPSVRAPLILQVVLGLDAKRIASAFLASPAAMGKRLVRPRIRSGKPAFHLAFRSAPNSPAASIQFSIPSTPLFRKAGAMPPGPTSSAGISPRKRYSWRGS